MASFCLIEFDYSKDNNYKGEKQCDDIKIDFRVFENKVHASLPEAAPPVLNYKPRMPYSQV